ncbi:MAG TPA: hypothetical protein VKO42_01690, partial [Patescibacteria group bacterium]|nr:hypothetical protein [Patescibacteria group bacterium]
MFCRPKIPKKIKAKHMQIIAGLGNPGKKYEKTRHNAGFIAVDALAEQYRSSWQSQKKFQALTSEIRGDILL